MDRRTFLGIGGFLLGSACSRRATATPQLDDGDALPPVPASCTAVTTAANIEGPFYKRGAPSRSVLANANDVGERLQLTGTVRSTSCEPLANARLDVWHANARGGYDLDGFRFRGVMTTDARGRWDLRSIVPGRYLNGDRYRPTHIHVKLVAKGYQPLTTQLYFADDPYNEGDPFIDPSLIMAHRLVRDVRLASFEFVLAAA
jgi:protocatechuate 3,4-dioxygenase beta subunit